MGDIVEKMKKVSVIIPMYNAEPYIRCCIRSVAGQSWRNLEILVIDDGSTDRSLEVCRKLSSVDERIQIFSQKNQGVSVARNRGIEEATGEYIFFLDSDDAIHSLLIEKLVKQAERFQVGMAFCSYVKLNDRQMKEKLNGDSGKECALQTEEGMGRTSGKARAVRWETAEGQETEEWFHIRFEKELSCIGGKLIRKNCIGGQRFHGGLVSGEDTVFLYELCRRQVKMAYAEVEWYYYRINPDSVSHTYDMHMIHQKLKVYERIRNQEYKSGHLSWALKWERGLVWNILSVYLVMKNRKDRKNSKCLKRRILLEMKNPLYRKLSGGLKGLFWGLLMGCSFPPVRTLWVMKQKICKTYV